MALAHEMQLLISAWHLHGTIGIRRGMKILGSRLAWGAEWLASLRIFNGHRNAKVAGLRTIANQAELAPKNYKSGGREFESLRARHSTKSTRYSQLWALATDISGSCRVEIDAAI